MRHARADYNRIQDPANIIPEGEPVFLLRAKDALMLPTVMFYLTQLRGQGGDNFTTLQMCDTVEAHINLIRMWQGENVPLVRMPDLPDEATMKAIGAKDYTHIIITDLRESIRNVTNKYMKEKIALDKCADQVDLLEKEAKLNNATISKLQDSVVSLTNSVIQLGENERRVKDYFINAHENDGIISFTPQEILKVLTGIVS